MKIRNRATGQIGHAANDDKTVLSLIQVGILEVVEEPKPKPQPAKPRVPEWQIVIKVSEADGHEFACIQHIGVNGVVRLYDGPPEKSATGFFYLQWDGTVQAQVYTGPTPPETIRQAYARCYTGERLVSANSQIVQMVRVARQPQEPMKIGKPGERYVPEKKQL